MDSKVKYSKDRSNLVCLLILGLRLGISQELYITFQTRYYHGKENIEWDIRVIVFQYNNIIPQHTKIYLC